MILHTPQSVLSYKLVNFLPLGPACFKTLHKFVLLRRTQITYKLYQFLGLCISASRRLCLPYTWSSRSGPSSKAYLFFNSTFESLHRDSTASPLLWLSNTLNSTCSTPGLGSRSLLKVRKRRIYPGGRPSTPNHSHLQSFSNLVWFIFLSQTSINKSAKNIPPSLLRHQ